MFCKFCGSEINNQGKFCPNCGAEVKSSYLNEEYNRPELVVDERTDNGPFKVFAIIGFIIGIESFLISWIPLIDLMAVGTGFFGALLSSLGIISSRKRVFAIIGLSLSILAMVIGIWTFQHYFPGGRIG